jgi:hypothetical protein
MALAECAVRVSRREYPRPRAWARRQPVAPALRLKKTADWPDGSLCNLTGLSQRGQENSHQSHDRARSRRNWGGGNRLPSRAGQGSAIALLREDRVDLAGGLLQASSMPVLISFSMSSRDSNVKCISIRVPPSRSVSRTLTVMTGMSAIRLPSWSAKASVNSSDVGGSTAVTRHAPHVAPSGPVMTYVASPPGVRSCVSKVAG